MVCICKTLSPFHQKMLCAKFGWNRPNGWNWPSGSWEEDENANSLQTEGQQAIIKNLRLHLRWAKKGGGMETNQQLLSPCPYPVLKPMWLTMHLQLLNFSLETLGQIEPNFIMAVIRLGNVFQMRAVAAF